MDILEEKYITKRWQELSAQEWAELRDIGICNGCGGRGSRWFERFTRWVLSNLLRVLSAVFVEASCEIHDFTYWQGGDEVRRKECDDGFFLAIAGDIQKYVQDAWKFVWYTLLALVFYIAVRLLGRFYFRYR